MPAELRGEAPSLNIYKLIICFYFGYYRTSIAKFSNKTAEKVEEKWIFVIVQKT